MTVAATVTTDAAERRAKYVFLFIGDGMGPNQVAAAQAFIAQQPATSGMDKELSFTGFEIAGSIDTLNVDSKCTDSAAAGTALATGRKTGNGVVAMDKGKKVKYKQITQYAKEAGYRIGIVTSESLNHATPAAFYAHQADRNQYYEIALQLIGSDFDFFGGGGLLQASGKSGSILDLAKAAGYTIVDTAEGIAGIGAGSGKTIALAPEGQKEGDQSLFFEIDRRKVSAGGQTAVSLADFVRAGISSLDGDKGFFIMCEGGKIDVSCHANDAAAAIWEVIAFSDAVLEAKEFAERHPGETLIVVTADHETGGLSIGETDTVKKDVISGLKWAGKSHTGTPVPIYAYGAYAELFRGAYDNTEVFQKLMVAMGLSE